MRSWVCTAIMVTGAVSASPAPAGNHLDCSAYAGAGVAQQQQNVALKCGFTGGRWSNDDIGHFKWCMGAGPDRASAETNARSNALANQCLAKVKKCWTELRAGFGFPPVKSVEVCRGL